jgi:hypothetical protein
VTWDISHVPKSISNLFSVRLRKDERQTPREFIFFDLRTLTSYLLILTVVLAYNFDPRKGHVEVTVPWVVAGNYTLVLFGDSGNWSEQFEILGGPEF